MSAEAEAHRDLPIRLQFRVADLTKEAKENLAEELDIAFNSRGPFQFVTVYEEGDDAITVSKSVISSLEAAGLRVIRFELDWVVRLGIVQRAGVTKQIVAAWTSPSGDYDFPEQCDFIVKGLWYWPDVEEWLLARGKIEAPEGRHLTLFQANQINRDLGQEVDPILRAMRRAGSVHRRGRSTASLSRSLNLQHAAKILGVALPVLVNLIDSGQIPSHGRFAHRRVNLLDVLAYRDERKAWQYRALEALGEYGDEMEEGPGRAVARMKEARKIVAQKRRAQEEIPATEDA